MKIVAIGHYKRVGKDSFANFVIQECAKLNPDLRVIKKSWAWKLKQVCFELYGWAGLGDADFYETAEGELIKEIVLPAIGKSPRQIWIDFGTKAVREQVYENTWRDYLLKSDHDCDVLLIPDTRFQNEVDGVEEVGGHRVKVVRPGFRPGNDVPDTELLPYRKWDNVIGLGGTMAELNEWAKRYAEWLCGFNMEPRITPFEVEQRLERAAEWEGVLAA